MAELWTNAETFAATEAPQFAIVWFVVNDNGISDGNHRGGIKVEQTMGVLSCRHCQENGGLAKEIKGDFGLGE